METAAEGVYRQPLVHPDDTCCHRLKQQSLHFSGGIASRADFNQDSTMRNICDGDSDLYNI